MTHYITHRQELIFVIRKLLLLFIGIMSGYQRFAKTMLNVVTIHLSVVLY